MSPVESPAAPANAVAAIGHRDSSGRIPALDGVRGIAILLVLLRHSVFGVGTVLTGEPRWKIVAGLLAAGQLTWSGVDLFFVLSGFLIGGILLDARNSPRYFQTFYLRRAHRILPLYFAAVTVMLFTRLPFYALVARTGRFQPLEIPWWAYATFTQNFLMAHLGTFGPISASVTWSLAIEEQFYLTIPWVIRRIEIRHLAAVLVGVIVGAPLFRVLLRSVLGANSGIACYVLTPARADGLSLGVLCALLVRRKQVWDWLVLRRRLLWAFTGALFCGVGFMTYRRYDAYAPEMTTWGYSWLAFFYAGFLLLALTDTGGWLEQMLRGRILRRLGTQAYCLYLIHISLMQNFRHPLSRWLPELPAAWWIAGGILGTGAALVIANWSWKYFERPLVMRGHRYQY